MDAGGSNFVGGQFNCRRPSAVNFRDLPFATPNIGYNSFRNLSLHTLLRCFILRIRQLLIRFKMHPICFQIENYIKTPSNRLRNSLCA